MRIGGWVLAPWAAATSVVIATSVAVASSADPDHGWGVFTAGFASALGAVSVAGFVASGVLIASHRASGPSRAERVSGAIHLALLPGVLTLVLVPMNPIIALAAAAPYALFALVFVGVSVDRRADLRGVSSRVPRG